MGVRVARSLSNSLKWLNVVCCIAFISDFAKFGFSLAIALLPLVRMIMFHSPSCGRQAKIQPTKQIIARRDDMPPPIAADLRPCADGSAVRTAPVAWHRRCTPSWPRRCALSRRRWDQQTDTQTDGRIAEWLNPPLRRWHKNWLTLTLCSKIATRLK